MKKLGKVSLILIVFTLTLGMVCRVEAQIPGGIVKTFYDSDILGIGIQVNATAETQPTENLTVWLGIVPQTATTNVFVQLLRLEVYGFVNGTVEVSIGNVTGTDVSLGSMDTAEYSGNFSVPAWVSGVTFGSITLTNITVTYSTPFGSRTDAFSSAADGFYMTSIENTYLKSLEAQNENLQTQISVLNGTINQLTQNITSLNESYSNLTTSYSQALANITQLYQNITLLNQNYTQLLANYTAIRSSANELDNTREVAVILGVTTVFFVATTAFMVMRRPKERW